MSDAAADLFYTIADQLWSVDPWKGYNPHQGKLPPRDWTERWKLNAETKYWNDLAQQGKLFTLNQAYLDSLHSGGLQLQPDYYKAFNVPPPRLSGLTQAQTDQALLRTVAKIKGAATARWLADVLGVSYNG